MKIPCSGTIYFETKSGLYFHKVKNATKKCASTLKMKWMKNSKNPFFTIFMKNSSIVINWKKHIITFEIHINDEKDMIQVAEYISLVVIDLNGQFIRADGYVQKFYKKFVAIELNLKLSQIQRQLRKEKNAKKRQEDFEIEKKKEIKKMIEIRDQKYAQQQFESPDRNIWHNIIGFLKRYIK